MNPPTTRNVRLIRNSTAASGTQKFGSRIGRGQFGRSRRSRTNADSAVQVANT